ncbi:hypothetical protein HNR00_003527 [Methylorubrum rhodinum]|uniref:Uncharacterized protein n=1 Tax=Methylorubrum rhodinum TaxID=29428 RepID=A0A840ZNA2_9HYPH|nr:hypothetical protein [Methylorubrum rhodinum]MBB5758800.1 hypothetical protein [Methylorubrum rhodinum]
MANNFDLSALDALREYLHPKPRGGQPATTVTLPTQTSPPSADGLMRSLRDLVPDRPRERQDASDAFAFSISRRSIMPSGGLRIVEDPHMTNTVEDWSQVRSPSRAARRRRQGHRQRIRWVERPKPDIYHVGDMLVMHPETARIFRMKVAASGDALAKRFEWGILNTICVARP